MGTSLITILSLIGIVFALAVLIALRYQLSLKIQVNDDEHGIILSREESVRLLDMIENPPPRPAKFILARDVYLKIKERHQYGQ